MALPLPTAEQLFHPGGPMVRALEGMNALQKHNLENRYYGPEKESEIGHRNALTKGQNIENEFMPEKLKLANAYQNMINQFYPSDIQSQIAGRNALTNKYNTMTPLEARELQIKNQFGAQREAANIANTEAQSNYYKMGGSSGGTGQKEELFFQNLVAKDNPQLKTPEQIYEATNAIRNGVTKLHDGTPLNPISPAARESLNRLTKGGTYAGAAVPLLKANQADAELKVLMNMSQKDFKPYATTYAGYSIPQIIDTFKTDDESQKKLGNFIASQAAQYEASQIRNRMAGGEPGISATQELMGKSGQIIKTKFPRLSAVAREQATKRLDEYLSAGLEARKKVGLGASEARGSSETGENKKATLRYNQQTGEFEKI